MDSFLKQGVASLVNNKPWLYCDSTWLSELTIAYDDDGNPETYVDSNGVTHVVNPRTTNPDDVSNRALQDDLDAWQEKDSNGNCKEGIIVGKGHRILMT